MVCESLAKWCHRIEILAVGLLSWQACLLLVVSAVLSGDWLWQRVCDPYLSSVATICQMVVLPQTDSLRLHCNQFHFLYSNTTTLWPLSKDMSVHNKSVYRVAWVHALWKVNVWYDWIVVLCMFAQVEWCRKYSTYVSYVAADLRGV